MRNYKPEGAQKGFIGHKGSSIGSHGRFYRSSGAQEDSIIPTGVQGISGGQITLYASYCPRGLWCPESLQRPTGAHEVSAGRLKSMKPVS